LLLTAARFDGNEAGRLGFAHFVVEDAEALEATGAEILAQARKGAPGAIARTKEIINAVDRLEGDELVLFAAERFADSLLGDEAREGLAAFAEKRQPNWS
jgi:isohexenylglutaconyl-CoA hydratase